MVDRTTNGRGYVNQMDLKDLKKLDAGIKFSNKFEGEKIPTLEEVLEILSADLLVNIELKNYHSLGDSLVDRVCEIVEKHNIANSTFFSSFYPGNIIKVRKIFPDAPVALITMGGMLGKIENSPFLRWISPNFICTNNPKR